MHKKCKEVRLEDLFNSESIKRVEEAIAYSKTITFPPLTPEQQVQHEEYLKSIECKDCHCDAS